MQIMYTAVRAIRCGGYNRGMKVKKESFTSALGSTEKERGYVQEGRKSFKWNRTSK